LADHPAGSSHRDAVVRMEPRETAYEKKAPFRSWASSENSFTEVPAGSDANCAVAVFPDQAICATFCTKSPAKLFSTSRIFVRPMAWPQVMSKETVAGTDGP